MFLLLPLLPLIYAIAIEMQRNNRITFCKPTIGTKRNALPLPE